MGKSGCIPLGVLVIVAGVLINAAITSPKIFWPLMGLTAVLLIGQYFLDKREAKRADKNPPKRD